MEYIDGFTQEKQTNIKKCNGCKIGCKIDAVTLHGRYYPSFTTAIPTIVNSYIDKNGKHHFITSNNLPGLGTKSQAIKLAHRIAKLCDHYKTR